MSDEVLKNKLSEIEFFNIIRTRLSSDYKEKIAFLLKGTLEYLFLPLEIEKKARALSILVQIKHNNIYWDDNWSNFDEDIFKIIFDYPINYDEYDCGFEHFKIFLNNESCLTAISLFLLSIDNLIEINRFIAILLAMGDDTSGRDEHLEAAKKTIKEIVSDDANYVYCLHKTKIDLLIFSHDYFRAADLCEDIWPLLAEKCPSSNVLWIRYQFAKTIIELSKNVKMTIDVDYLKASLWDFYEEAQDFDLDCDNS